VKKTKNRTNLPYSLRDSCCWLMKVHPAASFAAGFLLVGVALLAFDSADAPALQPPADAGLAAAETSKPVPASVDVGSPDVTTTVADTASTVAAAAPSTQSTASLHQWKREEVEQQRAQWCAEHNVRVAPEELEALDNSIFVWTHGRGGYYKKFGSMLLRLAFPTHEVVVSQDPKVHCVARRLSVAFVSNTPVGADRTPPGEHMAVIFFRYATAACSSIVV
jgi:hypothetical protein